MSPEQPKNPGEYSEGLEHANAAEFEAADTDRVIAETRHHIEELKKDKQAILEGNEYSQALGLTQSDIAQIDAYIQEAEEVLVEFEKIKAELLSQATKLKQIHEKGKELLGEHHPDNIT